MVLRLTKEEYLRLESENIEKASRLNANKEATKSKYGAKGEYRDGIWFASQKELKRYHELKLLEQCGKISNLLFQPVFEFYQGHFKTASWRVDFTYIEKGKKIAEDTTGHMTARKKKLIRLFDAQYPDWELRIT
jgi:hypothetical protein